jgi:hypothetical protein
MAAVLAEEKKQGRPTLAITFVGLENEDGIISSIMLILFK